jgi:uroporphyrinogen III methyltransferase/synthase
LIVFTSANAVRIYVDLLEAAHQDHLLAGCHLCAIGSETARALMDRGQQPDLIAGEYTAEGLVTALAGFDLAGARVLIPRAAAGRDVLPQLLAQAGADVEVLTLYRTVVPATAGEELRRLFASGGVDVVTFTSSSTVMNFVAALGGGAPPRSQIGSALVACMGPVTAQTSAELGLAPDVVAQEYTTAGLTGAIVRAVADRLGSR